MCRQAFRDIASLLGKILGEESLVPSDVAAGLVTTDIGHCNGVTVTLISEYTASSNLSTLCFRFYLPRNTEGV